MEEAQEIVNESDCIELKKNLNFDPLNEWGGISSEAFFSSVGSLF